MYNYKSDEIKYLKSISCSIFVNLFNNLMYFTPVLSFLGYAKHCFDFKKYASLREYHKYSRVKGTVPLDFRLRHRRQICHRCR